MNKKLNESGMQTELSNSTFFSRPASPEPETEVRINAQRHESRAVSTQAPPSATPMPRTPVRTDSTTEVRASAVPDERPNVRTPGRRSTTRYSFEFFQDQIVELRRRSLAQKLQGEDGSMSEMVREALDAFLALNSPDERPNDGTSDR